MTSTHALHHLVPLAQELDDNKVTPGLLGFVIFAAIAIGLYALMKNMGKQMKKIDFVEQPEQPESPRKPKASAARTADTPAPGTTAEAPRA